MKHNKVRTFKKKKSMGSGQIAAYHLLIAVKFLATHIMSPPTPHL